MPLGNSFRIPFYRMDIYPDRGGAAADARRRLEGMGHEVSWHEYDMAHAMCAEEIADIRDWLLGR